MKKVFYQTMANGARTTNSVLCLDSELPSVLLNVTAQACKGNYYVEDIPDEPVSPQLLADLDAMMVDHEYRIALLEIGVT